MNVNRKAKGKSAWLITWEGSEAEHNGRCKVVSIIPSQISEGSIIFSLRVLYHSESNLTLAEKVIPHTAIHKDPYFREEYAGEFKEYLYGVVGKHYLMGRKVKDLRWEEKDSWDYTLHWTETERYIQNPKYGEAGPPAHLIHEFYKKVRGKRNERYTYSPWEAVQKEVVRQRKAKAAK